jgi:L-ribulokinase
MKKYALGIDYGTESGRVLLVDISNSEELATHVTPYPHGVIDETLPGSRRRLGLHWALQHPDDYLEVLRCSVPEVVKTTSINPTDIVGIGIDFTTCTMLPIDSKGTPLCLLPEYRDHPHSWVELWKHHAAQGEADRINEIAVATEQDFLKDTVKKFHRNYTGKNGYDDGHLNLPHAA